MAVKIPVSFAENELHIYNYIKSKRNYSVYIKDLVEDDMKRNGISNKSPKENKKISNDLGFEF